MTAALDTALQAVTDAGAPEAANDVDADRAEAIARARFRRCYDDREWHKVDEAERAGWLYGARSDIAADPATATIAALKADNRVLREALTAISQPRDCGCVPCREQCLSQSALLIESVEIRDIARAALASVQS